MPRSNQLSYITIYLEFASRGVRSLLRSCRGVKSPGSHVKPEMDDIAFLHGVFLALQAQPPRFLCSLLAIARDIVVVGTDFSPDEALLELRVDFARGV